MVRHRVAALTVTVTIVAFALASCTSTPTAPVVRQAEVPVLWVSVADDGTLSGGVSKAQVSVDLTGSTASYRVETSGSGGADTGDSWDAAAAMASSVAVLYSGQDPRGVTTTFRVSDAIDGSSAGAVLTVAVLAALRGAAIDPSVAMTGTIGPDGSVGHVDGIPAKVRAAAAAGYTRVLVPAASVDAGTTATAAGSTDGSTADGSSAVATGTTATASASAALDTAALGAELGISVEPVTDVGQAMKAFTGQAVAPPRAPAPELSSDAQATLATQARRAIADVTTTLAKDRALLPAATRTEVDAGLAKAVAYRDADDDAGAYAAAVGTEVLLDQAVAVQTTTTATEQDLATANADVSAAARALEADAANALAAQARQPVAVDPVRRYARISASTWLTRAIAVMSALVGELDALDGEVADSVVEAATVVAQYRVAVDRIYPDSLAIADGIAPAGDAVAADVDTFVVAYTDLLGAAGAANQAYYEGVLTSIAANPGLTFSQPGHVYAAVQQLQSHVAGKTAAASSTGTATGTTTGTVSTSSASSGTSSATRTTATTASASSQTRDTACAWAMSYFLMTSYLVADEQSYDLSGTGIGSLEITAGRPGALRASFGSARDTAAAFNANLAAAGVAVDHATWTAGWAAALPDAFDGQPQHTGFTAVGLSVLWDADLEAFLNTASLDARQRPGTPTVAGAAGSPTTTSASAQSSGTATRQAADSCSDGGHGISVTFTNSTGQAVTMQTQTDGKWSDPFVTADSQSWTGTSPYNCDSSTYAGVSLTVQYELYQWHNNWVSVELHNHVGHSPDLKVCSLLGQGTEVWCDSFEGMLPGETLTMKPRTTTTGDVVGVVTVVRQDNTDANSQYEIAATCPDSGCTWTKPSS